MFKPENLIRKGLPKGHFKDLVVRSLLGGITYLIVAIAALLFGKIIIDGAPVLFKAEAPFVDFGFLTEKNETIFFRVELVNVNQIKLFIPDSDKFRDAVRAGALSGTITPKKNAPRIASNR